MSTFDPVIKGLYDAAANLEPWSNALQRLSQTTGSWFAQLIGVNKATGRVAFSVQSQDAPVDGVMDYVRLYTKSIPIRTSR